jgi:hypothetical protein
VGVFCSTMYEMGDLLKIVFGSIAGPLFLISGLVMFIYILSLIKVDPGPIFSVMIALTPIWLPIGLFYITFDRWMYYIQNKFAAENGRSTLRINLPQEVFKSPEAMESVFAQIHNVNTPDNLLQTYIDGKHPLTFSFELVSIGGEVRFYINVPTKKTKNSVEAQLYAQYPGIEVIEEDLDYTDEIKWDPEKYEYMAFHMGKKEDEVFPIKTYIDYGLDKIPKEEQKFEPMAPMLEILGKVKPHERVWVQILATPHVKKNFKNGSLTEIPTWDKKSQATINAILKRDTRPDPDSGEYEKAPMLTIGEREKIAAMERNAGKYAYEVGIRWLYITEKGKFDGDVISPMIRSFSQYDIIGRNGIGVRWRTDFDYNFISDRSGKRKLRLKKYELGKYKDRNYYHQDRKTHIDATKVFSSEELATIFHIPGSSVVTPTMPRITSARKEPPSNLPTGLMTPI